VEVRPVSKDLQTAGWETLPCHRPQDRPHHQGLPMTCRSCLECAIVPVCGDRDVKIEKPDENQDAEAEHELRHRGKPMSHTTASQWKGIQPSI